MRLKFALVSYTDAPDVWELQYRGATASAGLNPATFKDIKRSVLERVQLAFTNGTFDNFNAALMLRPHVCAAGSC